MICIARFHAIAHCACVMMSCTILLSIFSTESNLFHVEPSRMNFLQFLVVQNSKSEAERYLTGSLHSQLEVWNTAIVLLESKMFITDLPKFPSQPQTLASRIWSHRTGCGEKKYLLSKSPSWFIARIDIDLQFSFC